MRINNINNNQQSFGMALHADLSGMSAREMKALGYIWPELSALANKVDLNVAKFRMGAETGFVATVSPLTNTNRSPLEFVMDMLTRKPKITRLAVYDPRVSENDMARVMRRTSQDALGSYVLNPVAQAWEAAKQAAEEKKLAKWLNQLAQKAAKNQRQAQVEMLKMEVKKPF